MAKTTKTPVRSTASGKNNKAGKRAVAMHQGAETVSGASETTETTQGDNKPAETTQTPPAETQTVAAVSVTQTRKDALLASVGANVDEIPKEEVGDNMRAVLAGFVENLRTMGKDIEAAEVAHTSARQRGAYFILTMATDEVVIPAYNGDGYVRASIKGLHGFNRRYDVAKQPENNLRRALNKMLLEAGVDANRTRENILELSARLAALGYKPEDFDALAGAWRVSIRDLLYTGGKTLNNADQYVPPSTAVRLVTHTQTQSEHGTTLNHYTPVTDADGNPVETALLNRRGITLLIGNDEVLGNNRPKAYAKLGVENFLAASDPVYIADLEARDNKRAIAKADAQRQEAEAKAAQEAAKAATGNGAPITGSTVLPNGSRADGKVQEGTEPQTETTETNGNAPTQPATVQTGDTPAAPQTQTQTTQTSAPDVSDKRDDGSAGNTSDGESGLGMDRPQIVALCITAIAPEEIKQYPALRKAFDELRIKVRQVEKALGLTSMDDAAPQTLGTDRAGNKRK